MRISSRKFRTAAVTLGICVFLGAAMGQSAAGEPQRSGWYLGAGAGANSTSLMKQAGHNRDTTCYPDNDCGHLANRAPEGYRWFYDLDSGRGTVFEITVGRIFGTVRLELSAAQRRNNIEQKFTGISYLDGSTSRPAASSSYTQSATATVDDLTTRTLSLNVYHDFPLSGSRIVPYLGAGLGLSFVEVSRLYFHSDYSCTNGPCEPPGTESGSYDSLQNVDLSDTVLSGHLHAGADYKLDDRFLLGLKLSYSLVDDIEDRSSYSEHPFPDLTNLTEITGIDQWSLMFNLKYLFGD